MSKSPKYKEGQKIKLKDNSFIILKERWDLKKQRKVHKSDEITWEAYRLSDSNKTFVVKESEIPNQD